MRILHVIESLDTRLGGPPRSTVGLCRALAEIGHDIVLLTGSSEGWGKAELNTRYPSNGFLETRVTNSIYADGRAIAISSDIVCMQSVWNVQNVRLGRYCSRNDIPYVISPRGELDEWSMQQKTGKKKFFLNLLGRRFIRDATALHLLNIDERIGLDALNLSGRYFVAANGVDLKEWASLPPVGTYRHAHSAVGDKVVILFMARLHHKKGPALLARAFVKIAAKFPDTYLIVCGPDYGELRNVVDILIDAGLSDRADCPSMVHGESRLALMQDADIFVLPSSQEGHPRNVLEAAACGTTLVITNECHCPEFRDSEAAIVSDTTVNSVADSLERLLEDPALRKRLAESAYNTVVEKFSWDRIAEITATHYDTCIGRPGSFASI